MNIKKILMLLVILVAVTSLVITKKGRGKDTYKIGLIAPMQHRAMDQIIEGFKDKFGDTQKSKAFIDVQNAMGDKLLLRSLLNKFISQKYDVIVTIGTEATQLASQSTKIIPVIGLDVSENILQGDAKLIGVVESKDNPTLKFLRAIKSDAKKIAFIFSQNEKNFDFYEELKNKCKEANFQLQPVMVETLSDLYSLKGRIQKDADFILISKDHIAASGASIIAKTAEALNIPFISSDEGSVENGASAAISNSEYYVGTVGADIVKQLKGGKKIKELDHITINKFEIFVNKEQAKKQNLKIADLESASLKLPFCPEIQERGL